MKNVFMVFISTFVVLMGCSSSPSSSSNTDQRTSAAVVDELDIAIRDASDYLNDNIPKRSMIVILNMQSDSAALSDYIIDELISNAVNDKIFKVVDRQQLDLIRTEQKFQFSGEVDDNLALSIGKFFGAQTIVSGRVRQLDERYRMTIRALEVQTAQVQGQYNRNILAGKTITALMRNSSGSGGGTQTAAARTSGSSSSGTGTSGTTGNSSAGTTGRTTTSGNATPPAVTEPNSVIPASFTGIGAQLGWIRDNAENEGEYVIRVRSNESIGPQSLSFDGLSNVTIHIIGIGGMRTVSLSSGGSMFTVERGVTLILDSNITLRGLSQNGNHLVYVKTGATLIMLANSRITGNTPRTATASSSGGGGIYIEGGTFTMKDSASVTENAKGERSNGGGVYVKGGTFTMQDNTVVSGNKLLGVSSHWAGQGAGVCIEGGTFTMEGNATVTGNGNAITNSGGGIYITSNGILYMLDNAKVTGNTTDYNGGGVYIERGILSMEGNSTISGNTASRSGGGVYFGNGTFTLKDSAMISRNTVTKGEGGGVYLTGGTFTMQDSSAISGNTATQGGGLRINGGTFTKNGGTLSGNDAPAAQRNTASGLGSAVHAGNNRYRNATAGPTVNTNSPSFWAND